MPWPSESDTAELYYSPASQKLVQCGLVFVVLELPLLAGWLGPRGRRSSDRKRAAAFTADAARNGLGLRILDGTIRLSRSVRNGHRDRSIHHA